GEALAAAAHPAHLTSGRTEHQCVRAHAPRHHRARSNEGILAERHAADDRRIGADGRAPPHQRAAVLVLSRDGAAGIQDVREYHARTTEDVILELHALVYRHVVLDLHVVTDSHSAHDHHVLPQ